MRARFIPALIALVASIAIPASASAEDYLGMGDSYSSGNGTGTGVGDCVRSPDAFAPRISSSVPGTFKFVACSGAQTGNITTSGQNGEARQVDNLTAATKYVTLNIGGNDAGFTSILTACATSDCNADFDEAERFIRDDLPARLRSVFDAIKSRSPATRIVLVGYPRLFSPQNSCFGDFTYSTAEKQRANALADQLAGVERAVTREKGYTFVDPRAAFVGHAVCDNPEWINGFKASEFSGSFHPKIVAHDHFLPMAQAALLAAPNPTVTPGPRSRIAFTTARDGNDEIYTVNRDGQFQINLTQNSASDIDPAWSPDGTKIAFASKRGAGTTYEIYVANADGSGVTRLTNNAVDDIQPGWAPGGAYLVFRRAGSGIFSMTSTGASQTQLTTTGTDAKPDWSPDGAEIAFERAGDVYRMNADGQGQTNLTPSTGTSTDGAPAWAPSGLTLAFQATGTGGSDIYTVGANGGSATQLTSGAGGTDPSYGSLGINRADPSVITFRSAPTAGQPGIFTVPAAGGTPTRLTSLASDATPSWQADSSPPETTITSGPSGPTNQTTPAFAFTSSELGSAFTCAVDGGSAVACTSPFTTAGLAPGAHTIAIRATDPVGNQDPTPASRAFTVDTTAPETTINSGPEGATGDSTPTFVFSSSKTGSTFACRVDIAAFAPCTSPYTSPTLSDGSHSFEVRATDTAGNTDQSAASRAFDVDVTGPEAVIDQGPAPIGNQTSGSVYFSGPGDAAGFECGFDSGAFSACASPYPLPALSDGQHRFRVRAVDVLGNPGPDTELSFTVDTVRPVTTITSSGPPSATPDASPRFDFISSKPGSRFECTIDAGSPEACTSPFQRPFTTDGAHTFSVRAIDAAGNADASPPLRSFTVDTTPPETQIDQHPAPAVRSSSNPAPTFAFSAPGEVASSFQCKYDSESFATCGSPYPRLNLANGEHTFQVRALDAVGNPDPTPAEYRFVIDSTTPGVSFTGGTPEAATVGSRGPSYSFMASATEMNPVYECRLDAAPTWSSCNSPLALPSLSSGAHTFQVRALDAVGPGQPKSRTFTVDNDAPITTVTGPAGPTRAPSFLFTSSKPNSTFECKLDGASQFTPCPSPYAPTDLSEGDHNFTVKATSGLGNEEIAPVNYPFTVDTVAPDTTISGPTGLTRDSTPTFDFGFLAETGPVTYECRVDTAAFGACAAPFTTAALGEGPHQLDVRAMDAAGNTDRTPATRSFTVDTIPPDTSITSGPAGPTRNGSPSFSFSSGEAGATLECSLDAAAFSTCASPQAIQSLPEGAHTFAVRALDAAGNADTSPATRAFTVDTVAPDTTITSGPDGPAGTATPGFAFSSGDASATLACRVDAAPFSPCTSATKLSARAAGSHTFEVRATDTAGNADASPASRAFTVAVSVPSQPGLIGSPRILTAATRASRSGRLKIKIGCTGSAYCAGKLSLSGKVRKKGKKRSVAYGVAGFRVSVGKTAVIGIRLNRRGKANLASAGRLRVTATASAGDGPSVTRSLVIKPATRKRASR